YRSAAEGYGGKFGLWGLAAEEPAPGHRTDHDTGYESQRWNEPLRPAGLRLNRNIHKMTSCAAEGLQRERYIRRVLEPLIRLLFEASPHDAVERWRHFRVAGQRGRVLLQDRAH